MRWILLDVAIAVLALVALALVALSVWRSTKALGAQLGRAGDQLSGMSAALDGASPPGRRPDVVPTSAGHRAPPPAGRRGVRSQH